MTSRSHQKPTPASMRAHVWNTPAGRLIEWIRRYDIVRSHTAAGMVTWCWQEAIGAIGKDAALAAVQEAGLELPAFLANPMTVADREEIR